MALKMTMSCRARLHILHVLDHHLRDPGVTEGRIAEITQSVEEKFKENYLPILGDFKDYSFNCWEGDPANATAKFAESIGADFIVMGCHAENDKPSFNRLGETALAVLQWAPCPVMMVPCELQIEKMRSTRRHSSKDL